MNNTLSDLLYLKNGTHAFHLMPFILDYNYPKNITLKGVTVCDETCLVMIGLYVNNKIRIIYILSTGRGNIFFSENILIREIFTEKANKKNYVKLLEWMQK